MKPYPPFDAALARVWLAYYLELPALLLAPSPLVMELP